MAACSEVRHDLIAVTCAAVAVVVAARRLAVASGGVPFCSRVDGVSLWIRRSEGLSPPGVQAAHDLIALMILGRRSLPAF